MKKCMLLAVFCVCAASVIRAAEETDPGSIVANPKKHIGQTVTITVQFRKINNVFRGWEDQANLNNKIKFIAQPLGEIACYADKTAENEELIGGLKLGQEVTLTGAIRKYKFEAKVKGERNTVKRTVKGSEIYGFIVRKVENVGEVVGRGEGGRAGGMRRMLGR